MSPESLPAAGRAAVIAGLGAAVPPTVVTNAELAQRLDTSDEWIRSRTGIAARHIAASGTATSDLAVRAAERALASAGDNGGVDLVVLATSTPDHPCPATAPLVADRLGLGQAGAFDVSAVCAGFTYALAVGRAAIAGGLAERVLVIGAETFSTLLDPQDRSTVVIFGDGAGAVLLRAGRPDEPGAVISTDLGSDGQLADLIAVPAGGSRSRLAPGSPAPGSEYFTMNGRAVFRTAVDRMTCSSRRVLERTGWSARSVAWLVAHQANARILAAVAENLEIPVERAFLNLDRRGNTSAASIPLALADGAAQGRFRTGDRMLVTAFGGGAAWGSATFTWPEITVPEGEIAS